MIIERSRLTSALRAALPAGAMFVAIAAVTVLRLGTAGAHGNPEVKVDPNPADFGGEVNIEGEGFEEEDEVSLVLEGVLGERSLGTVTTDSEGMFSLTVTLPSSASPGSYRIRAVGSDDVAVADMRIQEGESGTAPPAAHGTGVGFHAVDSATEIAGFAGLAAALVLIGAALVWLPGSKPHA